MADACMPGLAVLQAGASSGSSKPVEVRANEDDPLMQSYYPRGPAWLSSLPCGPSAMPPTGSHVGTESNDASTTAVVPNGAGATKWQGAVRKKAAAGRQWHV